MPWVQGDFDAEVKAINDRFQANWQYQNEKGVAYLSLHRCPEYARICWFLTSPRKCGIGRDALKALRLEGIVRPEQEIVITDVDTESTAFWDQMLKEGITGPSQQ